MYRLKKFCDDHNIIFDYAIDPREEYYRFRFQRGDLVLTRIANKCNGVELDMIEQLKRDFHLEVADTTCSCMTYKYVCRSRMCNNCSCGAEAFKEILNRIYGKPREEKEKHIMNYYIDTDIANTYAAYNNMYKKKTQRQKALDRIQNVIFNDPATIVIWADGSKTVVKAENEPYDPEKGLAMAIAKKFFDNKGYYFDVFKKWLPVEEKEEKLVVTINPETKSTAIPLREYCDQENITKNKAMGQIHRGEILAFKNEKGLWMVVRE